MKVLFAVIALTLGPMTGAAFGQIAALGFDAWQVQMSAEIAALFRGM